VTAGGWVFMGVAWTVVTGLVAWCYARLLWDDRDRRG
jgi:hypothetical protein